MSSSSGRPARIGRWLRSPLGGASRILYRYLQDNMAKPHPAPVFVLGNQKSGTTAIAALIAAISGRRLSSDMLFHRGFPDYSEIVAGRVPVGELIARARYDFAAGVIKDPEFTFLSPQLADAFPAARFVLVLRDPARNIRSILERLNLPGDHETLNDGTLASEGIARQWRSLFDPEPLGLKPGSYIEVLARRWVRAASLGIADHTSGDPGVQILRYEDFRTDKTGTIARMARSVGLPTDRSIESWLDVAYQPSYATGQSMETFFGANNLGRIQSICGPAAGRFGY